MNLLVKHSRIACILLLMMLCVFCSACAETDAELWAGYQQPNVLTEGQAYIELIPSVQPVCITDGDMPLWRFTLFMTETNGVPFTADCVTFTRFDAEQNVLAHVTFEGNEYAASYMPSEFQPGDTTSFGINQPADRTTHYGIRLSGVDANGSACSFHVLVPMSQEILTAEKPDAFKAASEGSELIQLTPAADPVYLEELEFFDGGLGWASSLTVTNISDQNVQLTDMRMVLFTENEGVLVQLDYSDEAIAIFAGADSNVLAPGESMEFSDVCPYQDMMGYGFRFTAEDEDGNTQTTSYFYACVKEEKPE